MLQFSWTCCRTNGKQQQLQHPNICCVQQLTDMCSKLACSVTVIPVIFSMIGPLLFWPKPLPFQLRRGRPPQGEEWASTHLGPDRRLTWCWDTLTVFGTQHDSWWAEPKGFCNCQTWWAWPLQWPTLVGLLKVWISERGIFISWHHTDDITDTGKQQHEFSFYHGSGSGGATSEQAEFSSGWGVSDLAMTTYPVCPYMVSGMKGGAAVSVEGRDGGPRGPGSSWGTVS